MEPSHDMMIEREVKMSRKKRCLITWLSALGLGILLAANAPAQTSISVDINKAKLQWDWAQGSGGIPDNFLVKCGQSTGNYTRITQVLYPSTSVNISSVITGQGNWFCAVSAFNQFGESGLSNEVPFVAGAVPSPPSNARVTAN